jgi:hypothetical protein
VKRLKRKKLWIPFKKKRSIQQQVCQVFQAMQVNLGFSDVGKSTGIYETENKKLGD